ncbi:hypothetical protein ACFL0T_02705 [Candidatus Omnitrophota bacterium]
MLNIQSLLKFTARLSKREKAVFYAAIFFISLVAVDRLIVSPIYLKIISLNKEIKDKEVGIKRNLHFLTQKDRIKSEVSKYGPILKKFESNEADITSILKELEKLANDASVYLVDIKPTGTKEEDGYIKHVVKLNCEAQMEQIVDFIYSAETSDTLFTVEDYKISPKSKDSAVAQCSMSISRRTVK